MDNKNSRRHFQEIPIKNARNLSKSTFLLSFPPSASLLYTSREIAITTHIPLRFDKSLQGSSSEYTSIVSYLARLTTNIRSGPIPLQRISTGGEYVTSHYPHCWVRQKYGHVTWLNPVVGVIWRHLFLLYKNSLEENWITFSDSVSIPFL